MDWLEFYILFLLLVGFVLAKRFFNKPVSFIAFAPIALVSGRVYLSAVITGIFLINFYLIQRRIKIGSLLVALLLILFIAFSQLFQQSSFLNYSELLQLFFLILILIQIIGYKNEIQIIYLRSVNYGFQWSSILIFFGILTRLIYFDKISQDDYNVLSVSSTFNYTSYFLFFGLIVSPKLMNVKSINAFIYFGMFVFSTMIFESRLAFILGVSAFFYLNRSKSIVSNILLAIPVLVIGIFIINKMDLLDSGNQNDLILSTLDFSSNYSNVQRLQMISASFDSLFEFPFGWGVGQSPLGLNNYNFHHPHAHNLVSNWFFEFGVFGIVLAILFYGVLVKMYNVRRDKISKVVVVSITLYSLADSLQYNVILSFTTLLALMLLSSFRELRFIRNND